MAAEIVMPKLGATMEEGTIVSWLVQVGGEVEEGDPIAEIQTDKIVMEIEAEEDGVLLQTLYDAGTTVSVHEVIAYIGEEGEEVSGSAKRAQSSEQLPASSADTPQQQAQPAGAQEKIRRTPAARKLAEEKQIDLRDVQGTGPLGRIQKADVEQFASANAARITPLAKKIAADQGIDYSTMNGSGARGKIMKTDVTAMQAAQEHTAAAEGGRRVPFKGMRKVIADRIAQSAFTAPHVTLHSEIDMTECVQMRADLLPVIEKINGLRLSFNDIVVKAAAAALKLHPNMNVSLDGAEIVRHSSVHIGMAVAVPDGLVVATLRDAGEKALAELTSHTKAIGKAAREGRLSPDDMQGSTFTISNLGMYAVDGFTPIINSPNSAILGVGRIQKKAVVVDDEIVIRSMMAVSVSFDHRIIDGAPAAAFLTELKEILENPYKLLV